MTQNDLNSVLTADAFLVLESLYDLGDESRGGQTARLMEWLDMSMMESKRRSMKYPMSVFKRFGMKGLAADGEPDAYPRIHVGTIHSFKGAEADSVYVFPDLSPAGQKEWQTGRTRTRDAVVRCFYVAMTRASEKLTLCASKTGYAVPF